ncbi:MAG: addiction module antitoxin RelB [Nitrospira sp. WS110]|nr:addiction module antitoxin RelB [Nitrospira sp. WS110]
MAMNDEQLDAEIMKLDLGARARLAEKLILSLDVPSEEENLRLWVVEAERRLRIVREGHATEIPAEEIFRRARQAIS